MVDVSPLFALGQALAEEAIDTSGTTVRFETRATVIDPDTLTDTTTATALTGTIPALVVPAGNANATVQPVPGVDVRPGDWKVLVKVANPVPPAGSWVVIVTSRDPHQPGLEARVTGATISSAGAVLMVFARPGTPS